MSPRNEFKAGDEPDEELEGIAALITAVTDQRAFYRAPHGHTLISPGKESSEAQIQEVDPVEDDPHMWPEETREPTLAELRKSGRSTTAAHIARPATSD